MKTLRLPSLFIFMHNADAVTHHASFHSFSLPPPPPHFLHAAIGTTMPKTTVISTFGVTTAIFVGDLLLTDLIMGSCSQVGKQRGRWGLRILGDEGPYLQPKWTVGMDGELVSSGQKSQKVIKIAGNRHFHSLQRTEVHNHDTHDQALGQITAIPTVTQTKIFDGKLVLNIVYDL